MSAIVASKLKIGLEVHVELATGTKMFSRACSPARASDQGSAPAHGGGATPNTLLDPVVLGLPGALPVANRKAVEMSIRVGLALGCRVAPVTRWDRKHYFYPDLPKGYQISQYDLPLCFDGAIDLPRPVARSASGRGGGSGGGQGTEEVDGGGGGGGSGGGPVEVDWGASDSLRIGIIRAHLEEDAGKLLHEAPGGGAIDFSIVDFDRAGTPLLEIVTQPDFRSADEAVLFCQVLHRLCRWLGVTEGVLQKGHMRFEPNINCELTLDDGRLVTTPIVEVKNLNSFRAVRGAIEFEAREQPGRWAREGRVFGPGTKQTRGWDDVRGATVLQREKEDAHDYRYFPDPDLLPVPIERAWVERVAAELPESPVKRQRRYMDALGLSAKEAAALIDEPADGRFYEAGVEAAMALGLSESRAGKAVANILLQSGSKRVNAARGAGRDDDHARGSPPVRFEHLGVSALQIAAMAAMREDGRLSAGNADALFGTLADAGNPGADAATEAERLGLLTVRDDAALDNWVARAIADNAKAAADVRGGKDAAIGRLVGAVMKLAEGRADAAEARKRLLRALGRS
ncbi:MAG: Asp-tRNA(Asn)/Glu-tRNA(Gln) amidotransferase subunit GatB [Phycisphaerales bacterium]